MNTTKTNIKNITLTILITILVIIMASEIENPNYWWVQFLAGGALFIIIKFLIRR